LFLPSPEKPPEIERQSQALAGSEMVREEKVHGLIEARYNPESKRETKKEPIFSGVSSYSPLSLKSHEPQGL